LSIIDYASTFYRLSNPRCLYSNCGTVAILAHIAHLTNITEYILEAPRKLNNSSRDTSKKDVREKIIIGYGEKATIDIKQIVRCHS
jgi:hypothetical protein